MLDFILFSLFFLSSFSPNTLYPPTHFLLSYLKEVLTLLINLGKKLWARCVGQQPDLPAWRTVTQQLEGSWWKPFSCHFLQQSPHSFAECPCLRSLAHQTQSTLTQGWADPRPLGSTQDKSSASPSISKSAHGIFQNCRRAGITLQLLPLPHPAFFSLFPGC